ncbi:MAG: zinc ribbon domain-containing protein [Chloroflexi bacterium]|nr:zinc ribbon domain-containing protein [Chloroflexota bacterium]
MPIYDYVCEDCGHVMEVAHGIHAPGPTTCPECGGTLAKAFAPPAIHFRGSGWAKKDRKSVSGPVKRKAGEAGGTSEPAAGGPAAGSGTTSDATGGE